MRRVFCPSHQHVKWLKQHVTADQVSLYLAYNATLYPGMYDVYLDHLVKLSHQNKVCLLPLTIFQVYHKKLKISSK